MSNGSILDAIIRSAANAATFGFADNAAAAGDATLPLSAGASTAPSWPNRYAANLAMQAQADQQAQGQHGTGTFLGNLLGGYLNPIYRLIPSVPVMVGLSSNPSMLALQQQQQQPVGAKQPAPSLLSLFGGGQ
jgi:hypothetical protein